MQSYPITFATEGLLQRMAVAAAAALLTACGGGGESNVAATAQAPASSTAQSLAVPNRSLLPAHAGPSGNVVCNNQIIAAVSLDSVFVPANAACRLEGTTLIGSVQVAPGASLEAQGVRVSGSLQADGAAHVVLVGNSHITGALQLHQGGSASISGSSIVGDLQVQAMSGSVQVSGNQVGGSVQAFGNRGGVTLTDNMMQGNLQCGENLPAPVFAGNLAASADGQCLGGEAGGGGGSGSGGNPPPVLSGNVTCIGLRIGDVPLDSVIVPAGAQCTLEGTVLNGNIEVGAGARLVANAVQVTGGMVADGAAELTLGSGSRIGGSVQMVRGGVASIIGNTVLGDLQIDSMRGVVSASGNRVSGNLQAMANRGGIALLANTFGGVMQCKDNRPAPTGRGNVATLKEDQCLRL
jgi:hypothetical protein